MKTIKRSYPFHLFFLLKLILLFTVLITYYSCKNIGVSQQQQISQNEKEDIYSNAKATLNKLPNYNEVANNTGVNEDMRLEYRIFLLNLKKISHVESMPDTDIIKTLRKIRVSYNKFQSFSNSNQTFSCPGDCNAERQACKENCQNSGKRFCGCLIAAGGCTACCILPNC